MLLEIAQAQAVTASALQTSLDLDRGYLSRIISRFEEIDCITRDKIEGDSRTRPISLAAAGRKA